MHIIKHDVVGAVVQFFQKGWLLPGFNSNLIILIPKVPNADKVEMFKPIALANFKFKTITKILVDRLSKIAPKIFSPNQRGFIIGREIGDCICLASEDINLLDRKSFGGNLAMNIDIKKAFDTIDWRFLLKVLNSFGFDSKFGSWIESILHSAKLSVSMNRKSAGYFSCSRGVRQGDSLAPLFFCLAEEILRQGISKLVMDGGL